MIDADHPVWVAQLEVAAPARLEAVSAGRATGSREARVLVRLHGDPMGFLDLPMPPGGLPTEMVLAAAWQRLAEEMREHLSNDAIAWPDDPAPELVGSRQVCRQALENTARPPLSVVLCTRNRPKMLRRCLDSLQRLHYRSFEVVVVDNAPPDDATLRCFDATVGADPRFRYVREPVPGLSVARNQGLAEASHAHVAFTDDDVTVDPWWLDGIARGLARATGVGCVTGIVPSASLENAAQRYFDRRVTWSKALRPRLYELDGACPRSALFPFDAGSFGTGANFAVERDLVVRIGGFDEALGAGSPAGGGEDLDMFVRILRAGRALACEPSAIVWHHHRSEVSEMQRQMRDFGVGLGAYLTKQLSDPSVRRDVLRRAPRGAWHMLGLWRDGQRGGNRSPALVLSELWGIACGPSAYLEGRRAQRRGVGTA